MHTCVCWWVLSHYEESWTTMPVKIMGRGWWFNQSAVRNFIAIATIVMKRGRRSEVSQLLKLMDVWVRVHFSVSLLQVFVMWGRGRLWRHPPGLPSRPSHLLPLHLTGASSLLSRLCCLLLRKEVRTTPACRVLEGINNTVNGSADTGHGTHTSVGLYHHSCRC